jgi:hypothetical protein
VAVLRTKLVTHPVVIEEPRLKKERLSEAVYANVLMGWLKGKGWDCYPEVQLSHGGTRIDIVAVLGPVCWAIEVKTALNLDVMCQASDHRCAVARSIAVPWSKGRPDVRKILDSLQIGMITISPRPYKESEWDVEEVVRPPILRANFKMQSVYLRPYLCDEHKKYAPGTQHSYYTPYRGTIDRVVEFVRDHQGCTIKQLVHAVNHHYASDTTARAALLNALQRWEFDKGIRVDTSTKPYKLYHDKGENHGRK